MKMRIWKFGDNVDTDQIIPAEYLTTGDAKKLAAHAFVKVRPEFSKEVQEDDVIVAGDNFGCGSSREHAPRALLGAGIRCVVAKSFARIFFRNSINIGLPLIEVDIFDRIEETDQIEIRFDYGVITNLTKNKEYQFKPLPEFMQKLLESGGLINYIKEAKRDIGTRIISKSKLE
ncbi:MAG: 3-isopropylmalate dehydratase small subunit [Methanosarcinales archaeon]|nr:3-isopropylmalate dehydratase small subunit [Methanosarcinales archaeon]